MPTMRLVPSTYYLSSSSYLSVTDASDMYDNTDSTTYATVRNSRNSTTSYYIYLRGFNFDDIPAGAIVTDFEIKLKARESGVSTSTSYKPYLANGTSAINGTCDVITTTASVHTFSGISADWDTIVGYGSNFGIRINCRRASRNTTAYMYIYGAEIEVTYTLPVYHTVTVSGVNAEPTGQNQVIEGDSFTAKCVQTTKPRATDNGVDVTDRLVQKQDTETIDISNITSTYGFELNSDGYYESNNQGHSNSAAVCRVTFDIPATANIVFTVINYAESTYDYGLLSEVDESLSTNYSADSSGVYWSGRDENSAYPQTVTYRNVSAGEHYIDVKYFKDQYTDDNNDSLQFKVEITYDTPPSYDIYWGYTLTNITGDHVIVFSDPAAIFVKESGTWTQYTKAYKKVNGTWVEQSDLTSVFNSTTNYVKGD